MLIGTRLTRGNYWFEYTVDSAMMQELVRYWHGMVCGPARMALGLMCVHTDYWYAEFATLLVC